MTKSPIAAVLLLAGTALGQTGTLDQSSSWSPPPPAQTSIFNIDAPSLNWQQQVRTGMAGSLEGVKFMLTGPVGATMNVRIRQGSTWTTSPVLFTGSVSKATADPELAFVNMTASAIQLAANDVFVIELQGNGTGLWLRGSYVAPPGTPVYPEPLYLLGSPQGDGGWRFGFETYMIGGGGGSCYANCDSSTAAPVLNVADFTCFLQRFAAGESYANCDQSTAPPVLNVADFTCFLQRFAAGCP
jgi:hypothetical protein